MKPTTYKRLLKDLQRLQKRLVAAYTRDARAMPARMRQVTERWKAAEVGGRLDDFLEVSARRSAVQVLLRTVYVRVLEDLGALNPPRIRGQWGLAAFRDVAPALGLRSYLAWVFRDLAKDFPALFTPGPDELPLPDEDLVREVWDLWHAEDGKGGLVYAWQAADGQPADFDSRFLGDLYQDLDKEVRKRFALLQTPVFVEEYILDHALSPALAEFDPAALRANGQTFRLIDPTCGSGHFLIGAFHRLADWWEQHHGLDKMDGAVRALESVWGADLNAHAVDIARFRLLLEVRARTGVTDLERLAALPMNLAVMDTLIPWERLEQTELFPQVDRLTRYATDSEREANAAFLAQGFHVVVGNPPYISPKDAQKRDDYRLFWPESVGGRYPLSVPFVERFFTLGCKAAFMGQITSNSFMKREFGKTLVTQCLPNWDLTGLVDTSLAAIPGHGFKGGTPTVILFGRCRPPVDQTVWAVLGKRGETGEVVSPAKAPVWTAIATAGREPNDKSPYVSVTDLGRTELATHPWVLGSKTSLELVGQIEKAGQRLSLLGARVGHMSAFIEDEVYLSPPPYVLRDPALGFRSMVEGQAIRDWILLGRVSVPFPFVLGTLEAVDLPRSSLSYRHFWRFREILWSRKSRASKFAALRTIEGARFYEYPFHSPKSIVGPGIVYPTVASHNHYVLVPDGILVKQSSPMVKFREKSTLLDYYNLLGLLNSSVHGYWSRSVTQPKGQAAEPWMDRHERDTKKIAKAPLSKQDRVARAALVLALESFAKLCEDSLPEAVLRSEWAPTEVENDISNAISCFRESVLRMVALQEELDWLTYKSYGLLEELEVVPPDQVEPLSPGHRPFEIIAARADEDAPPEQRSAWWSRHGHPKATEIPKHYSAAHQARLEARVEAIQGDAKLQLLESFPFKRRWQLPDLEAEAKKAARLWLLDRLEDLFAKGGTLATPRPYRLEEVVTAWTANPRVTAAAAVAEGSADLDLTLVAEKLLAAESLPDNPRRIYTTSGLRKLDEWKEVWALQDREDQGETGLDIAKPPEFTSDDFAKGDYYSVRGKLNVPRERFIAFADLAPVRYGWNGWRDLDRGLAQVEAYTEAESDPHNPLPAPTHEDPRRCGVTLGLWESLDDVRRWSGADHHGELSALAQEACRQERCPCDLVKRWQQWANGEIEVAAAAAAEVADVTLDDRARLVEVLKRYGSTGAVAAKLARATGWSSRRVQLVLDDLVATGDAGKSGRGARTMYALPDSALPQQKLF